MQPKNTKNPFSDEVDVNATDPGNLYTGSGSQMFKNERAREESIKAKKLEERRSRQQSELIPVANDLLEMLAAKKSGNADFRSYMLRLRGSNAKGPTKQLTKDQIHQLEVQAEARELNIALIEEIEGWIQARLRRAR